MKVPKQLMDEVNGHLRVYLGPAQPSESLLERIAPMTQASKELGIAWRAAITGKDVITKSLADHLSTEGTATGRIVTIEEGASNASSNTF